MNKHDTAFAKHVIHVLYSQLETDTSFVLFLYIMLSAKRRSKKSYHSVPFFVLPHAYYGAMHVSVSDTLVCHRMIFCDMIDLL